MEIKPRFGIDKLLFGMKQKEVEAIYGEPDKKFNDDEQNAIVVYNQQKWRLTFYEDEDYRLGYIITSNQSATLLGATVIGRSPETVKEALTDKSFAKWETEDFDLAENHFNEANWIILQSEFGEIAKIELGAIINDKDEFDWKFTK